VNVNRPTVALIALSFFVATPTLASRTLQEPKNVKSVLKRASKSQIDSALTDAGLKSQCTPTVLKSKELMGVACRLAVFSHRARAGTPKSSRDVEARMSSAKDAHAAAVQISGFDPLTKPPGLAKSRFEAHRQACRAVREAWDAVRGVPKSSAAAVVASADKALATKLAGDKTLRDVACDCTAESLSLAQSAGVGLDVAGELQGAMTSRGCGLDATKIKAERGGPATKFTGAAAKVAEASTDEAQLLAYAKTRDIGFDRCRDSYLSVSKIKDAKKLLKCACGEVTRWSFPKKRGRPDTEVVIPIREGMLGVRAKISAPGKVLDCGPLEGKLVK
jgi:hypothetical protein